MPQPRHTTRPRSARALPRFGALLLLLSLGATSAAAQQARPIRALYVTGGGFHDFVAQEQIVPPGITARTNIVWTVDHTAGEVHRDADPASPDHGVG